MKPAEDELLPSGELDRVASMDIEQLRERRSACQVAEVRLSFLRRLAQARLDIVHAEIDRRASGGGADLEELVAGLAEALASHLTSPQARGLPNLLMPDLNDPTLTAELDAISPPGRLTELDHLGDEEIRSIEGSLAAFEHSTSDRRRLLHERIDAFQREIVRRYRDGEASVDSLLR